VRDRRRARVRRLHVPQVERRAFERHALPQYLPARLIERVHHPALRRSVVRGIAVAVQPGLEGRRSTAADGARHEDALAPDDRTRVTQAWNPGAPEDVLAARAVPG